MPSPAFAKLTAVLWLFPISEQDVGYTSIVFKNFHVSYQEHG
jgi:hypothetical protein